MKYIEIISFTDASLDVGSFAAAKSTPARFHRRSAKGKAGGKSITKELGKRQNARCHCYQCYQCYHLTCGSCGNVMEICSNSSSNCAGFS